MRFKVVATLLVSVWIVGALHAARGEQAAPASKPASEPASEASITTWSGVYSEPQAELGLKAYTQHCAECHGQDLGGDGFAPALKGPEFMNNWNGLSVGDLFDRIRISMPPTTVNAVSVKDKVDIVAYLLKEDGFPAGTTELPETLDAMKAIKFEATKPGR